MKRMLVLVLAIVMVMSMAGSVVALACPPALPSPGASSDDLTPSLDKNGYVKVILHDLEEIVDMSEAIQNLMAEAKEKLKDACPAGFAVKYFCYVEIIGAERVTSVDFDPIEHNEIMFKQYIDGEWTELKSTVNKDGTIIAYGVVEAPLAIFTK